METEKKPYEISWHRSDFENLCGFKSGKFTGVNMVLALILGTLITLLFYGILLLLRLAFHGQEITMIDMFFHGGTRNRSTIPYYTVFFTGWSLAILIIKNLKLSLQKKALALDILPKDCNFALTALTAEEILDNIHRKVDSPSKFVLLDRIDRALSNLQNLGNVSAVSECLKNQAENDENLLSTTYIALKGFVWAIPVLGFIGTVLGLSDSIGGFGAVVQQSNDIAKIKSALGTVTGGLGTAFETTLIALVLAMIVQLLMTFTMNREENFLDACSDYCHKNIISKIKSISLKDEED